MVGENLSGNLKFEYDGIGGSKQLSGPVLSFRVRYSYDGMSQKESTIYFGVRGGFLTTLVGGDEQKIGLLDTEPFSIQPLAKGGSGTLVFNVRLSHSSLQQLSIVSKQRIFRITVDTFAHEIEGPHTGSYSRFIGAILASPWKGIVGGKIDGNNNVQSFQVPLDSWLKALKDTGYMDNFIDTIIINSSDREDIHSLLRKIQEANDLLIQGKPGDSVSKLRDIMTWAGYKRNGEKDRYQKLKEYSFSEKERNDVVSLLDALWKWTSHGHHQGLDDDSIDEDQAKAAIDLCYIFVGLVSRRKRVGVLPEE